MNWEAVLTALAVGVPSLTLGYLGYRQSRKVDATSAQSGVASNHRAGTAQIIEGLQGLVKALQDDNDNFRDDIKDLAIRLEVITTERDALKLEVAQMQKKYGVNGNG